VTKPVEGAERLAAARRSAGKGAFKAELRLRLPPKPAAFEVLKHTLRASSAVVYHTRALGLGA
jgi:hypothetical protein